MSVHTSNSQSGRRKEEDRVEMLVLETDETHPATMQETGGFGKFFDELFSKAGQRHEPPLKVTTHVHFVVDDPEKRHKGHVPKVSDIPENVTAILITGSTYDAHGDAPWILELRSFVRDVWTKRPDVKFAGICFGHQLLARVLGARVEPTPGEKWELAHTSMDLSPVGRKLFRTDDSTIDVHQMHQDQVVDVPSPETTNLLQEGTKVHVWASTDRTEIQGLYIRDRLFTSQGHLELDEVMVRRQIELRVKSGSISEEDQKEVNDADETAHLKHDGEVIAAAILRFFHGDDHDID